MVGVTDTFSGYVFVSLFSKPVYLSQKKFGITRSCMKSLHSPTVLMAHTVVCLKGF